mmetsp:Transcript_39659/g.94160  ORF Transcript_39659/g.94160 Transcript_39659/m.94160 type:complete len:257 (-) Transcript_39659:364-1134(-)
MEFMGWTTTPKRANAMKTTSTRISPPKAVYVPKVQETTRRLVAARMNTLTASSAFSFARRDSSLSLGATILRLKKSSSANALICGMARTTSVVFRTRASLALLIPGRVPCMRYASSRFTGTRLSMTRIPGRQAKWTCWKSSTRPMPICSGRAQSSWKKLKRLTTSSTCVGVAKSKEPSASAPRSAALVQSALRKRQPVRPARICAQRRPWWYSHCELSSALRMQAAARVLRRNHASRTKWWRALASFRSSSRTRSC